MLSPDAAIVIGYTDHITTQSVLDTPTTSDPADSLEAEVSLAEADPSAAVARLEAGNTMRNPLTKEDHARIDSAVAAIERRERIDIAIVVTPASDRYALVSFVWAALSALTLTALIALIRPRMPLSIGLVLQLLLLFALTIIFNTYPIRMLVVPKRMRHSRASQLAQREFAVHALSREHQHGVMLFFASLAEHYFEVIGDKAIHARMPHDGWNRIVAEFTSAARDRNLAEALLAAIARCDQMLQPPTQTTDA